MEQCRYFASLEFSWGRHEKGVENVDGAPVKITNLFFAASVSYRFGARAHLHLQKEGTAAAARDYDKKSFRPAGTVIKWRKLWATTNHFLGGTMGRWESEREGRVAWLGQRERDRDGPNLPGGISAASNRVPRPRGMCMWCANDKEEYIISGPREMDRFADYCPFDQFCRRGNSGIIFDQFSV